MFHRSIFKLFHANFAPCFNKWALLLLLFMAFYFVFVQLQLSLFVHFCRSETMRNDRHQLTAKILDKNPNKEHLSIVKSVFLKLGYQVNFDPVFETDWDVLWSHPYPFNTLQNELRELKDHQKVNHFPGSGFITQKAYLAALDLKCIPRAFSIPLEAEDFLTYSKTHSSSLWVQKSSSHRGINILDVDKLNLETEDTFIQEFIRNPLLVSNRKFDIGIYVVLTSINPLRVYEYSGDVLLRFCTEKYHPFDSSKLDSYVVGDDYLPIWEVPDLKHYYSTMNYTAKESLNMYLLSKGMNYTKVWAQISEALRDVYVKAMDSIMIETLKFGNGRNFFEMVRFDFVVDEDLNVFVLEANMSPNLSSAHFPQNKLLYEQVLFNTFSLIGLQTKNNKNELQVSERDIQVSSKHCISPICNSSDKFLEFSICNQCMTEEMKSVTKSSYMEHLNRNKYRRIVPAPSELSPSHHQPKTHKREIPGDFNMFMERWYNGKCIQDSTFCQ